MPWERHWSSRRWARQRSAPHGLTRRPHRPRVAGPRGPPPPSPRTRTAGGSLVSSARAGPAWSPRAPRPAASRFIARHTDGPEARGARSGRTGAPPARRSIPRSAGLHRLSGRPQRGRPECIRRIAGASPRAARAAGCEAAFGAAPNAQRPATALPAAPGARAPRSGRRRAAGAERRTAARGHQRKRAAQRAARQERTGGDLLSQALASQVPSALWGLTALFGMGRGVSPTQWPPEIVRDLRLRGPSKLHSMPIKRVSNPSSPRPISTGLLRVLPLFQIRPINLVVYQGSYSLKGMGELISRPASRLDAFSGYPIRT